MRAIALVVVLVAELAAAQVAGVCGAGKNCTVRSVKTTNGGNGVCITGNNADWGWTASTSFVGLYSYSAGSSCTTSATAKLFVGLNDAAVRPQPSVGYFDSALGYSASLAFASFPTCNAGLAGRMIFDSTNGYWRFCDGAGTWVYVLSSSTAGTVPSRLGTAGGFTAVSSYTAAAASEETNFLGTFAFSSGSGFTTLTSDQVSCNWEVAGTGGSTGVVVRVYDQTAASSVCTCTLGACTTTARSAMSCKCTGTLTAGNLYALRLSNTTDCTANPQNVTCNVAVVP